MQRGEWDERGGSQRTVFCTEGRDGALRLLVLDDAETSAMKTEKCFLNAVITGYPTRAEPAHSQNCSIEE